MTDPAPLIVIGAATALLEVIDLVAAINRQQLQYTIVGALDDDAALHGTRVEGIEVLGGLSTAKRLGSAHFVFAISSYRLRLERINIWERLGLAPDRFVTLIHPTADIAATANIGRGCLIYGGAFVGPQAIVDDFCIAYNSAFLSSKASMRTFSMLAGHAFVGSGCTLERGAFVAAMSGVAPGVSVGAGAMVAMGSVAFADVPAEAVVRGNPAEIVKRG
jgi:sugar O-acyltransferase (sialic acid O-acetyltransferase NeuD family)